MEASRIKMAFANVKFHARILWRGFFRTVYGALIAGLIAMAIYGFVSASKEAGWDAVFDYIVSSVLLLESIGNMYFMGRLKENGARGKSSRCRRIQAEEITEQI